MAENPFTSQPSPSGNESNPFLEKNISENAAPSNASDNPFASKTYTKFDGPNFALRILDALQVPTTLVNQWRLGEPLDIHRVTTGTDVIRKLQEKPIEDRFSINPFMPTFAQIYRDIPAALSAITPKFDQETKQAIESGTQSLPGIPSPVKTVAGKFVSNPELITGLISDVVSDPLNVIGPVVGKVASKAIVKTGQTLAEILPEAVVQSLKTRFIPPIQRVTEPVRNLYQDTLAKKNLTEAQILSDAQYGLEKMKATNLPEETLIDLLEKPKYGIQDAAKATTGDTEAFSHLHTFTLGFKGRRVAEKEALQRAGIAVPELELGYVPHVLTEEAKKELGETGLAKLGFDKTFNLTDPSLFKRNLKGSINEINAASQAGKLVPGFSGKLFETDPVFLDAIAKTRTAKILAEKDFYQGLKQFAVKEGVPVEAKMFGKDLLSGLKFDPEVKELLENSKKYIFTDELNSVFDKAMNTWKSAVTSFNPQFSLRNAFSNFVSNAAEGLVNPRYYEKGAEIMAGKDGVLTTFANGKDLTYADVRRIATENGFQKGFFSAENPKALKEMIYPSKNPMAISREINGAIESHAKFSLLAYRLVKGDTPQEAVNVVKRALFDYSELTSFEKQSMKKIFPFYTWVRKNLPRQVELALTKPQINSKLGILKGNMEALEPLTDRQKEAIPGYYNDLLSIHIGKSNQTGKELFLQLGLPQVELSRFSSDPDKSLSDNVIDTVGRFVGDMNPILKTGIELVTNRSTMDLNRQSTVDKAKQLVRVPEYVQLLPTSVQGLLGVKHDKKTDSMVMPKIVGTVVNNLLSVPQLRIIGKQNSEKLTDEDKSFSLMAFLTGLKFVPTDLKKQMIIDYKQRIYERRNQRSDAKRFKEVDE